MFGKLLRRGTSRGSVQRSPSGFISGATSVQGGRFVGWKNWDGRQVNGQKGGGGGSSPITNACICHCCSLCAAAVPCCCSFRYFFYHRFAAYTRLSTVVCSLKVRSHRTHSGAARRRNATHPVWTNLRQNRDACRATRLISSSYFLYYVYCVVARRKKTIYEDYTESFYTRA